MIVIIQGLVILFPGVSKNMFRPAITPRLRDARPARAAVVQTKGA